MDTKKLLIVVTQSELGGAQRWVADVALNLKDKYKITIAAGGDGPLPHIKLNWLVREINPLKDILAIFEIKKLIKKEQPDVLQLVSTKAGFVGSIAAKIPRQARDDLKVVYRIGGWSFNDPRSQWQNKLFLWAEKITAPLKDKIIVNSKHDYDQALELGICPKDKLELLYNGIDQSRSVISKKSVILNKVKDLNQDSSSTTKVGTQNDKEYRNNVITIGCIANFYPTKGLTYLIEAANLLKNKFQISNFKFQIIGDGQQRPELEKLIKKYDLENIVKLAGQKENPWQYFADQGGIDIFVISSVKEGIPYVLLEAMAVGLPVVATTVGGISEIIKDKENGLLVPPKNPQALVEVIKNLIEKPELGKKLGRQAAEDIKKYSLEKMLKQLENAYKSD